MTKDIPIIFSGPMVRALLDGRKTMTRRIVKNVPEPPAMDAVHPANEHKTLHAAPYLDAYCGGRKTPENLRGMSRNWCWWTRDDRPCAQFNVRFAPGDRLWVRENLAAMWNWGLWHDASDAPADGQFLDDIDERGKALLERYAPTECTDSARIPSIHMPRWASRLTLIVTGVKVERLQDISEADAQAEGIVEDDGSEPDIWYVPGSGGTELGHKMNPLMADRPSKVFASLWRALHGADAWNANPYVVAITFTVHKQNIDTLPKAEAA